MRVRCQRLSYRKLRELAHQFMSTHHPSGDMPTPIEDIIDLRLKMNIVPVRELQKRYGIEGALGADFSTIYVDEWIQEARTNRYNFTLAHELAHFELHQSLLRQIPLADNRDWFKIMDLIDDETHAWMEWQAYSWAGIVLVPQAPLATQFETALEQAKQAGFYVKDNPTLAKEYISEALSRPFAVSADVIYRRITYDKLL